MIGGLLDLKELRVDGIVSTRSALEKVGAVARGVIQVATFGSILGAVLAMNLNPENVALAARPDGQFFYTLDTDAQQVTVIDVQTAAAVKRITLDGSVFAIGVSLDGKHLLCYGKKIRKIDLESHMMEK